MQSTKSGESYGTAHLIERRLLLSNVLKKAVSEAPVVEPENRFRVLTISRDRGSMGDAIAQELAGHLGWHVFDKEIVNYIAENNHVRESLVRQLDERSQSLIQDTIHRFLGMVEGGTFGIEDYHHALIKALAYLAARGEAIIIGRGANFALRPEAHGLHIRITASPETRVARLSERWKVPASAARKRMLELDSERRDFVRRHFHRDVDDDRAYDLIFNTDRADTTHVIASILAVISLPARITADHGPQTPVLVTR